MYEALKQQFRLHYDTLAPRYDSGSIEVDNENSMKLRKYVYDQMDAYLQEHPYTSPSLLKSRIHRLIAEACEPVIFTESPFFFETGMLHRFSWGICALTPAHWLGENYNRFIMQKHPIAQQVVDKYNSYFDLDNTGLCNIPYPFDYDHHTLGYTTLFACGVEGLMEKLHARAAELAEYSAEKDFCDAAIEGCESLLLLARRFADKAENMLAEGQYSERERRFLGMIAETARHIPAKPPKTFYEGLAMLLFTREAIAALENIGISQLGHLDRLLGGLYQADLAAGRITEAEARELLDIWMLYTDIKFDLEHNSWPETSTCIQLGGCDEEGNPVCNDVTRMVIEEHHRLGILNPKLNCRYGKYSSDEYLMLIGQAVTQGHNNFVLINDEVVIPGLMRSGVRLEDARLYVSGGCQETMIEGCGHTEGAALYISVPKVLDLFLRPMEQVDNVPAFQGAENFEEFYERFQSALRRFLTSMTDQRNLCQQFTKNRHHCPLFSATQTGCIESARDYVEGGARYNLSTIALVGLGTVADSLNAIRTLVYERKRVTIEELISALAANWEGYEDLRREALALPKYGHDDAKADALANQFLRDTADYVRHLPNERGGHYVPSLFVYYYFQYFAAGLRATPDGRFDGDLLSPGCAPSRLSPIASPTVPIHSMSHLDFTACGGGSAVMDMQLPASHKMTPELFSALVRACGQHRCPTLQPNVVSQEELIDAQKNPEAHKDLIVRISGLSAYFVALTRELQDEIISRNLYSV